MSTAQPTQSPTADITKIIPLLTMLVIFMLIIILSCMCVFLSHAKNVAVAMKINMKLLKRETAKKLKKYKIQYIPTDDIKDI